MSTRETQEAERLIAVLRSWSSEDAEGRVMTVVEDTSVVDYCADAADALEQTAEVIRCGREFMATTSYYRQRKESRPEFEALAAALARLEP